MRFLAFALLLAFALTAKADGIFSGGTIGNDGIYAGKSIGGANGINNGSGGGSGPPGGCNGVLDLSTGCAQLVAFGGLF